VLRQLWIAHTVQLMPDNNGTLGLEDAQFTGNGTCRVGVIARDHHGANPGALAAPYSIEGLGPGRVLQADQSQEDKILLNSIGVERRMGRAGPLIQRPFGKGQHAQRLCGHQRTRLEHTGTVAVGQYLDPPPGAEVGAALEDHFWSTFDKGPRLFPGAGE
jgi:hypothetical protein